MNRENINLYGATWCPDTSKARRILENKHVHFAWYDVDADGYARAYVESLNDGECRIPTIVFSDGSVLVEPEPWELEVKLADIESRSAA